MGAEGQQKAKAEGQHSSEVQGRPEVERVKEESQVASNQPEAAMAPKHQAASNQSGVKMVSRQSPVVSEDTVSQGGQQTMGTRSEQSSATSEAGKSEHRYLLTGGGTGGHVYPAIAIADELRRREPDAAFLYVGVKGKAEEQIVEKRGYPLVFVKSRGWPGARPGLALLRFVFSLSIGILQAIRFLRSFQPTVIIATGGYVSAPIMLAWILLKRLKLTEARAFVHEQNLVPGRLNRLVGRLADRVGVSFEETCRYLGNAEWLGYPARKEVGQGERQEARTKLGLPTEAKVILAFGGSQGARSLNRAVVDALPSLLKQPNVHVIHGVGRFKGGSYNAEADTQQRLNKLSLTAEQKKRYQWESYLDPIDHYYAAADIAVCRAGAGTITELALCGIPAVLIPKANLPGDHQVRNARAMEKQEAIALVYEQTVQSESGLLEMVEGEVLAEAVLSLLKEENVREKHSADLKTMADPDATERITDRIQMMARGELPPLQRPASASEYHRPELSDMSGGALVNYITRNGLEDLTIDERDYLAYRTDSYLAQPAWQSRNIGVKLVGLLRLLDRLDLILYILQDKTPAPRWHRMLGGDYLQVGFIRRNAMQTLIQLDFWNPKVRQALLDGLADPYFEVCTRAADAVIHFADSIGSDKAFLQALDQMSKDSAFEVSSKAFLALGHIDDRESTYERMKEDFQHPNWRLRSGLLESIQTLVQRGIIGAGRVQNDLDQFLLTSTGFTPHFALRERMQILSQSLQKAKEDSPKPTDTSKS